MQRKSSPLQQTRYSSVQMKPVAVSKNSIFGDSLDFERKIKATILNAYGGLALERSVPQHQYDSRTYSHIKESSIENKKL